MERILIIGCGGSGKTTLARQLGEITGLPVVHLDQIFWSPGDWHHLSQQYFDDALALELEKPQWIMDGNYDRTLEKRLEQCDAVIYLDFPMLISFFGWIGRVTGNWGKAREDMAPGCKEWFDPEMAVWIWKFNRENRKKYYKILETAAGKKVWILKNRRQVKKFLRDLEKELS